MSIIVNPRSCKRLLNQSRRLLKCSLKSCVRNILAGHATIEVSAAATRWAQTKRLQGPSGYEADEA